MKKATAELPSSKSDMSVVQIDIESDESIKAAFQTVQSKFGKLDVLINNAGAQLDQRLASGNMTTREMWNKSWDISASSLLFRVSWILINVNQIPQEHTSPRTPLFRYFWNPTSQGCYSSPVVLQLLLSLTTSLFPSTGRPRRAGQRSLQTSPR